MESVNDIDMNEDKYRASNLGYTNDQEVVISK